ncbi:MAG TPA: NCS2 family permease [Humisphaera sp.]
MSFLDRTFQLRQRKSSVSAEVRGALATFLAMAYILPVNAFILSGAGLPPAAVVSCTALGAAACSIAMGLWANMPIALASGMGLNAAVAFLVSSGTMTWQMAMGVVVLDGLLVLALVLLGLREAVLRAVPHDLRLSIGAGIGLFIAFIGLVGAGIVRPSGIPTAPLTFGRLTSAPVAVSVIGLIVTSWLVARKVRGALVIGIAVAAVTAALLKVTPAVPPNLGLSFETAFQADVVSPFKLGWKLLPILLSLVMVDFFDTLGTVTGIADEARLADKAGNIPGIRRVLIVDSVAASVGGLLGCSSVTSYVESAAGVAEGARTGLHSVVVGLLFAAAAFAAPLLVYVPKEATAAALILVGFYMIGQFAKVNFEKLDTAVPAFITLITIPLTYSIAHGIGYGFVAFVAIKFLSLRWRDVHPVMWGTAIAFASYLAVEGLGS